MYQRSYSNWIDGANRPEVTPYWLNPYVNVINQGAGDGREGTIQISNAWVDTNTGDNSKSNTDPTVKPTGNGWLRVTETKTAYAQRGTGTWNEATTGGGRVPFTRYYVKRSTGTWTTTDMQGTAGYVRVTVPNGYTTTAAAEQPFTANVRIDTQTPGANINAAYNTRETLPQQGGAGGMPFNGNDHPAIPSVFPLDAATATLRNGTDSTVEFELGDDVLGTDGYPGYLYGIRAEATKSIIITEITDVTNTSPTSAAAYDKVARSVIMFYNIQQAANWGAATPATTSLKYYASQKGRRLHLWIRGGDVLSGNSLTPGFPLKWGDTAKGGAGLFTGPDDGLKYWISWGVNATAYYHFVAGTTKDKADAADGPLDWGWAKNAWSFQHHRYPLHPGGSMRFTVNTAVVSPATETFEFYNTGFSGSRK
jgi:hypothetical protein